MTGQGWAPENRAEGGEKKIHGAFYPAADCRDLGKTRERTGSADTEMESVDRVVSISLTQEQGRLLQTNPNLSLFPGGTTARGLALDGTKESPIVVKFVFDPAPPVRMMKTAEVAQMLRVSERCLKKIIRDGKLKSYRFERFRRINFDDVLSYLETSREYEDIRQAVLQPNPPAGSESLFSKEV